MTMKGVNVTYLGRTVPIDQFSAFVYGKDGSSKLAKTYRDFVDLIATGQWFITKEAAAACEKESVKEADLTAKTESLGDRATSLMQEASQQLSAETKKAKRK